MNLNMSSLSISNIASNINLLNDNYYNHIGGSGNNGRYNTLSQTNDSIFNSKIECENEDKIQWIKIANDIHTNNNN